MADQPTGTPLAATSCPPPSVQTPSECGGWSAREEPSRPAARSQGAAGRRGGSGRPAWRPRVQPQPRRRRARPHGEGLGRQGRQLRLAGREVRQHERGRPRRPALGRARDLHQQHCAKSGACSVRTGRCPALLSASRKLHSPAQCMQDCCTALLSARKTLHSPGQRRSGCRPARTCEPAFCNTPTSYSCTIRGAMCQVSISACSSRDKVCPIYPPHLQHAVARAFPRPVLRPSAASAGGPMQPGAQGVGRSARCLREYKLFGASSGASPRPLNQPHHGQRRPAGPATTSP